MPRFGPERNSEAFAELNVIRSAVTCNRFGEPRPVAIAVHLILSKTRASGGPRAKQ